MPNVGKSTLFNALTKRQQAAAENYPFCTIEPNTAVVEVQDARLEELAKIVSPQQIIRATVDFTDIAGLVKGASKGEGLGNKFLANIRECDAILHVVRCFENDDIIHVQEGGNKSAPIDPVGDAEVIETELVLADMEQLQRRYERVRKEAQAKPQMRPEAEACAALLAHLESGKSVRSFPRSEGDAVIGVIKELHFLTEKPVIYCANVGDDGVTGEGNPHVEALAAYAAALCCLVCILLLGAMLCIPQLREQITLIFHILPVILLIAAFSFMLYSLSRDLIGGLMLQFFVSVTVCFVSGCLYPVYFFPVKVQQLAQWLPAGVARSHLSGYITGEAPLRTLLLMLGYCVLCAAIGVWARARHIKEVAE